jgi:hypothetical protein
VDIEQLKTGKLYVVNGATYFEKWFPNINYSTNEIIIQDGTIIVLLEYKEISLLHRKGIKLTFYAHKEGMINFFMFYEDFNILNQKIKELII